MPQEITKEEAHSIVDQASTGFLMVFGIEPKKTIGHVPIEEKEYQLKLKSFKFEEER